MVSRFLRRQLPLVLTLVIALFVGAQYYFGTATPQVTLLLAFSGIMGGMAGAIGIVNVTKVHLQFIKRKTKNQWLYSILLLATLYATIIVGVMPPFASNQNLIWLYQNVYSQISQAIAAVTGIFFATAIYRTFRAKSIAGLLLIIGAAVVILGNMNMSAALSPQIPSIGQWVMQVPTAGAYRGIVIGAGIGSIAFFLRLLIGKEAVLGKE